MLKVFLADILAPYLVITLGLSFFFRHPLPLSLSLVFSGFVVTAFYFVSLHTSTKAYVSVLTIMVIAIAGIYYCIDMIIDMFGGGLSAVGEGIYTIIVSLITLGVFIIVRPVRAIRIKDKEAASK